MNVAAALSIVPVDKLEPSKIKKELAMPAVDLNLSANLEQLNTNIIKVFTASQPTTDPAKIMPIYSAGVLANENLLKNATLVGLSTQLSAQLNNAKTLMNQLGVKDISKAPAITLSSALRIMPGYYHTNPGFSSNSVLPDNSSVIIASQLDLTNTTLTIDPSVATLTIIVETLTSGQGAQITYDDSTVWNPVALPATTAQSGVSYNPNSYGGGATNGPNGGNGTAGQPGSMPTIVPPAAPNIAIYALNISAMPAINIQGLKGAPGNPGQNGGAGGNGGAGKNGSDAWPFGCTSQPGTGGTGGAGGNGGNGSAGGEGATGGNFSVLTTETNWQTLTNDKTWMLYNNGGPGGNPGLPGTGGAAGQGGVPGTPGGAGMCHKLPVGPNGAVGANGQPGADGQQGNGGTINPFIITEQEWEEELTLPWLQTINPSEGYPGTSVIGVGLNFGVGDTVLVNGQSVAATFPASGQFKLTLPSTLAGGTTTIAVRRTEDGLVSNAMNFTVEPFIASVSPSGGYTPGDVITLTGAGFLANASVHLTQPSQSAQVLIPTTTTASSIVFQVPGVTSATSQAQGTATLTVVNPDGLSSNTVQMTRLSFLANGFLPSVNGFAFTNASAGPGSPTLGTFASDFGTVEVAASAFLNPVLTAAYYALYAVLLGPECHGLCTGFACGAMDRFMSGFKDAFAAFPASTPALNTEFTIDWGRQMSGELLSQFFSQCVNGQAQVLTSIQQVESAFSGTQTRDNMPLVFFIPSGLPVTGQWFNDLLAGHTIAPYKLVRPLGWSSGFNGVQLYIYDCNNPGNDNCFITFTQNGSTVSFDYGSSGDIAYNPAYSSANGFTLGVATMDQALYTSVDLPWMSGAGWIVEFVLSPATLAVSNLAGQVTGQSGSNIAAQVPGVIPSLLSSAHNLMLIPPQLGLQRTIQGTGNGTYTYVSIAPPGSAPPATAFSALLPQGANAIVPGERGFTLQNVPCSPATKDVILVGPDNQSIQITTNDANKTFNALIAQRYHVQSGAAPNVKTTQEMQVIQIETLSLKAGEHLLLWTDAAIGQVGLSNTGAAKNFTLTVSSADPTSGKVTASQHVAGSVAANGDFAATIPSWQNLAVPTTRQGVLHALLPANFQMPTVK